MARILIVEDDRPFADTLALMLGLEGHEMLIAVTAETGIEFGLKHCPDVVIADWMLRSDLDGGDVCRRIQAACPAVKTILMTGYLDLLCRTDPRSKCRESLIEKPFHKQEIIEAVNRALTGTPISEAGPSLA